MTAAREQPVPNKGDGRSGAGPMSAATLTRAYAVQAYRASIGRPVWVRMSGNVACDECAGRQLEARSGSVGARKRATWKRTVPVDGPALFLCSSDAQLWRDRDAADMAAAGAR